MQRWSKGWGTVHCGPILCLPPSFAWSVPRTPASAGPPPGPPRAGRQIAPPLFVTTLAVRQKRLSLGQPPERGPRTLGTEPVCRLLLPRRGGLFGGEGLRLPEQELVQEGVDRLRTLQHDHVAALVYHLQEGQQQDLGAKREGGVRGGPWGGASGAPQLCTGLLFGCPLHPALPLSAQRAISVCLFVCVCVCFTCALVQTPSTTGPA